MANIKSARIVLSVVMGFLGLGAIGGGGALIVSPSGELIGMPLSILSNSPFKSFLIPGIILFSVLGVIPTLLLFPLLRYTKSGFADRFNIFNDMQWAWTFTIYIAFALIIWIQAQMLFIHAVHWAHTLYMFIALAIIFVALLPSNRNTYKKINNQ
jgi:magnesium-transporting ATPase (P-type)